jgi:hypothetical protein
MADETLPVRQERQRIVAAWFNRIKTVLSGDFVPRGTSGAATNRAGALGSGSLQWLRAYLLSGYWSAGDVKVHQSYNASTGPGHGWMLCDGRVINEANYDAEHGAGAWDTYVGSSPLDGKYLPDADNKYLVGAATTPATGASAIPTVGNANHEVNLEHNHQWHKANGAAAVDQTYDSSGNPTAYAKGDNKDVSHYGLEAHTSTGGGGGVEASAGSDLYTNKGGSATQSVKPESHAFQVYMRVI